MSVRSRLTYTHTPVFRALAGWAGCTLGKHFPWTKTKQLRCTFLFALPIMILFKFCFFNFNNYFVHEIHKIAQFTQHSPIQHINFPPKTKSTHSLMCLATKMWSMKMCSFVPFFLKRPRRAACEKNKWIICNYLYTEWETQWNRMKAWNRAI